MTAAAAQEIMAVFYEYNMPIPTEIANSLNQFTSKTPPQDENTVFNELLQHVFWQSTTTPLYDDNESHLPSDVNPEDPSDWFDFFLA